MSAIQRRKGQPLQLKDQLTSISIVRHPPLGKQRCASMISQQVLRAVDSLVEVGLHVFLVSAFLESRRFVVDEAETTQAPRISSWSWECLNVGGLISFLFLSVGSPDATYPYCCRCLSHRPVSQRKHQTMASPPS